VKNIHHHKRSPIEQNDVAADHDVLALRRRRGEAALEVLRAAHNLFLQSGRQSAAHYELALESGRQAIALGQAWRQVLIVLAVPASHFVAVVIGIRITTVILSMAFTVSVAMIVVIVAILFIVAVTVPLGDSQGCREGQAKNRARPDSQPYLE